MYHELCIAHPAYIVLLRVNSNAWTTQLYPTNSRLNAEMLWRRRSLNSGQKTKQENLQQRHHSPRCPRLLSWWYRCCFSRRLIFACLVRTSIDVVHIFINSNLYTIYYWTWKEKINPENTIDNYTLYNHFHLYQFADIYQPALFKVLYRVRWFFIFYKRLAFLCSRLHL